MNPQISVTILAKNSSKTLGATLDSLQKFPEVLVLDTGSNDATLAIAKKYPNVRIYERKFLGFGKTHNMAASLTRFDWILSIDSDEVLSEALADEILHLTLHPKSVYSLDRHNYFQGKRMKCCSGWYPDWIIRLYHRGSTQFTEDFVHEKIVSASMSIKRLQGALYHTPYLSMDDFIAKMQLYTSLVAEQNRGKPSSLKKAIGHGLAAFFKNYVLKRGFLGGKEGFVISLYNAHTAYYKYLKLSCQK